MGYRHYLGIIKKEDFKKIDSIFIINSKYEDEDLNPIIHELLQKAGMQEVFELGKWSAEGGRLELKDSDIPTDLFDAYNVVKTYAKDHEYGFNVLTPRDLLFLIRSYKRRIYKYFKGLLEKSEDEKTEYIRHRLNWLKFSYNTKLDKKMTVSDSWDYESEIFNLLHIYKTVDWDKYLLVIYGW